MNQEEIDWAARDCENFRRACNRTFPFSIDELPPVNSPAPYPVLPGQTLEWHYRSPLSGNIEETLYFYSVRVSHCLVWVMTARKKNRMASIYPI